MPPELEAGFAKLQGEDFEYYMQTYSIILGRNSKKSSVDVDLTGLGGGMNISRQHARIFYDFDRKRFALEVLGKNGCQVEGVLYLPGNAPVKLESQCLLQIGDKKFYFLLPIRSILKASTPPSAPLPLPPPPISALTPFPAIAPSPIPLPMTVPIAFSLPLPPLPGTSRKRSSSKAATAALDPRMASPDIILQPIVKRARGHKKHEAMEMTADRKPSSWLSHDSTAFLMPDNHSRQAMLFNAEPKVEVRRRAEAGAEASPLQAEEKDVVSAVATVLSDLCGPGEWMPMPDLHLELVEHYSSRWPQARVRKYLTADDINSDSKGRPWAGLLALLRKYPEHFVINTRTKGRVTSEFVSLVSLLS